VQGVVGTSATNSGLILTPLMLTSIAGSVISGQLVSRLGKYKWIAILGMIISIAGGLLLVRLDVNSGNNDVLLAMLVMGLGMGFGMSLYTLIVQNALPRKIGQATSALVFFRSIGGTIGLAAMGSLMTSAYLPAFKNALPAAVKQILPAKVLSAFNNPQILLSPEAKAQLLAGFKAYGPQGMTLFNTLIEAMKTGLTQGIHNVFVLSLGIMIIGLVAVFFIKEIPLRGGRSSNTDVAEGVEDAAPDMAEDVSAVL
jgi:MFS family permease